MEWALTCHTREWALTCAPLIPTRTHITSSTDNAPPRASLPQVAAFVLGPPLRPLSPPDVLLFFIPFLNAAFFVHHALAGPGSDHLPPDLKAFVATLGLSATVMYARACGLSLGPAGA